MTWPINVIRQEFPILQRTVNGKRLVYLDNAATTQKPRAVIEAITTVYTDYYANVHRGIYSLAEEATAHYEDARRKVARFINAGNPVEVIFVRNATEGLNLLAYSWGQHNIRAGDRIIITELEHHSNLVPWQHLAQEKNAELTFIPITGTGELDLSVLPQLLEDGRTKLVACSMMSNVVGTIPPVKQIIKMAHDAGAVVILDGAQGVAHFSVDVQALDADFMAFSGHKMCGPGVGVLWGKRKLLNDMPPFLFGGDMIRTVKKYFTTWNDLPYKFEAGTPAIAEAIGLGAAVDYLTGIGMEALHRHEQELAAYAMHRLMEIPGMMILGPSADKRGGVVAFSIDGIHPHDIATILDEEGVCIRAGLHCAEPLHMCFSVPASARASFYLYNGLDDVDAMIEGLRKVIKILRK